MRRRAPLEDALLTLGAGPAESRLVSAIDALVAVDVSGRPTARADAGARHGEEEPHANDVRWHVYLHGFNTGPS